MIVDDFSHYFWCFPLQNKSLVFTTLQNFFTYVHTQFNTTVRALQADNGKEFVNNATTSFFDRLGVRLRLSCPYTSPQNRKANCAIRTINDTMRTLLLQAQMPSHF